MTNPLDEQRAAHVDWRDLYRFQTAMRYMDNRPSLSLADAERMADEDCAAHERAALTAPPLCAKGEECPEAVKWQRRYEHPLPDGTFADWHDIGREQYDAALAKDIRDAYSYRALYTHPAAHTTPAQPRREVTDADVDAARSAFLAINNGGMSECLRAALESFANGGDGNG